MKLIQGILPLLGMKPGLRPTAGWKQDSVSVGPIIIHWPWLAFCMLVWAGF